MIAGPTPPGFREPRQERSRETLRRIVSATESILTERGPEGVTVQDVVDHAGTSVGSFYARFDGKEAVLRYVEERFWRSAEERWDAWLDPARWRSVPAATVIARVVRTLVRLQTDDRRPFRAFLLQALAHPDAGLLARTRRLDRRVAERMAALMAEHRPGLGRAEGAGAPARTRLARTGFLRVIGAARDLAVFGEADDPAVRDGVLALVGMYGSLLGVEDLPGSYREMLRLCVEPTPSPRGRPPAGG